MALTDTFVKQVKATANLSGDKHSDGGGLYLHVKGTSKYWRMAYRFGGKQKTLALGVYPAVSLAKARKARDVAREQLADGLDPSQSKREQKTAVVQGVANTFEVLALEWLAMRKSSLASVTVQKLNTHLKTHVFPLLGKRPIAAIKPPEVLSMLKKVADGGAPYTATRIREICGQVFRFAIATGRAEYNPASELRGALATPAVKHRPALTTRREFGAFVRDLRDYDNCYPLTKQAARFALLTWTRPKELRLARWDQFDLKAKEWRVPAINMKMGKHLQAHTVPLSPQALEVLASIRAISGGVPQLFPGNHGADSVMSENTINGLFKKMGYQNKQSHHGLRASARSLLSERGWTAAALETQLDHAEQNKVIAAYARSEHLEERRKFMDDWGALVATLEAEDTVRHLKAA